MRLYAAIVSAALVACGDKAPDPPTSGSATPTTVDPPRASDAAAIAPADAAAVVPADATAAAPTDAEAPTDDAKVDEEEARKRRVEQLERALERRRRRGM